jgi:hypothetical protein
MMPPAEIVLPAAGVVLYILLSTLVARRAERLMRSHPEVFLVVTVHGFRAAIDTLLLILVWTLILPGLNMGDTIPVFGTRIPTSYMFILSFTVFYYLNFRLRILLGRRKE